MHGFSTFIELESHNPINKLNGVQQKEQNMRVFNL